LAGRSIWRDAASTADPALRIKAGEDAARRLAELAQITRVQGRPFKPQLKGKELTDAFPEFWYTKWQR
jgi:tagatose 1,6-diphosphate aldolase